MEPEGVHVMRVTRHYAFVIGVERVELEKYGTRYYVRVYYVPEKDGFLSEEGDLMTEKEVRKELMRAFKEFIDYVLSDLDKRAKELEKEAEELARELRGEKGD